MNVLFDGNDTTINQIAFGDGNLDVCDVYVTYPPFAGPVPDLVPPFLDEWRSRRGNHT